MPESGLQAVHIWTEGLSSQYASGAVEMGVQVFADHKHRNSWKYKSLFWNLIFANSGQIWVASTTPTFCDEFVSSVIHSPYIQRLIVHTAIIFTP